MEKNNILLEQWVNKEVDSLAFLKGHSSVLVLVSNSFKKKYWQELLEPLGIKYKIICYAAIKRDLDYEVIIADSAHIITQAKINLLSFKPKRWILLSHNMPLDKLLLWRQIIDKFQHSKTEFPQDIQIFVYNITLDNNHRSLIYEKSSNQSKKSVIVEFPDRFKPQPNRNIHVRCTEFELYQILEADLNYWSNGLKVKQGDYRGLSKQEIDRYKLDFVPELGIRRKLQLLEAKRNKLFEEVKNKHYEKLSERLRFKERRHLSFCGSIEQANLLGGNNVIHSDNKESNKVFQKFISGEVNSLYVVNMEVVVSDLEFVIIVQSSLGEVDNLERLTIAPKCLIMQIPGTKDEEFVKSITKLIKPEYIKELKL